MNSRLAQYVWPAVLLLAAAATVEAALAAGGIAFSKRVETRLLAEPRPLATVTGKVVGYAKKLTVTEAQGAWLRVSDGGNSGWVFKGSVSENQPEEVKGLDGLSLDASKTTATAAARPLTPAATDYATKHNLVNAHNDLEWLLSQCSVVTAEDIDEFLKTNKRGEYQ